MKYVKVKLVSRNVIDELLEDKKFGESLDYVALTLIKKLGKVKGLNLGLDMLKEQIKNN